MVQISDLDVSFEKVTVPDSEYLLGFRERV